MLLAARGLVHAADPVRLAVLDFEVQSDNPAYRYLGKGFAGRLSVTYQLVATETGEILLKDTVEGPVGRYGALTAGIARGIVRQLPAAAAPPTTKIPPTSARRSPEASC